MQFYSIFAFFAILAGALALPGANVCYDSAPMTPAGLSTRIEQCLAPPSYAATRKRAAVCRCRCQPVNCVPVKQADAVAAVVKSEVASTLAVDEMVPTMVLGATEVESHHDATTAMIGAALIVYSYMAGKQ